MIGEREREIKFLEHIDKCDRRDRHRERERIGEKR